MDNLIEDQKNIITLLTLYIIVFNLIRYNLLPVKAVTTFFEGLFICISFIINFLLIGFSYNKVMFQIHKIIYPTIILMIIWFTSFTYYKHIYGVSDLLSNVTLILSIFSMIIFNLLYIRPEKELIGVKNMCIKALYPIIQQHRNFFFICYKFYSFFAICNNNIRIYYNNKKRK